MTKRITPPDWSQWDPNMFLVVKDAQDYYEAFTSVVDERSTKNELAVGTLDGRVTALEHSTPVGPGGKGAYLNLGGTPERYPTAEEMVAGDTPESTSFLVVARTDGIYFYNPKSKLLIPPKKGGGTVAIHASFPDIFDEGHTIKHDTRIGKSGVYTAKCADVGLDGNFLSYDTAKILVVTTSDMEYQTALHPDGTASRTFVAGNNVQPWSFHTGTGGGGSSVDPIVIQEINRRLALLEAKPDPTGTFEGLTDTQVDMVSDAGGLIYLGHDGRIRGGAVNPMLAMGYTPVQAGSVGFHSVISPSTIAAVTIAASPVIVMTAEANRIATLPNVVPFDTVDPSTTQVRVGRVTYFVNASNTQKTLRVTSGQHFHKNGNMDTTNVVLPAKTTYIYNPAILDNGSGAMLECFVFMGQVSHEDADMAAILAEFSRIQDLHEGQQAEIDFIKTEQEHGKLTVEGLQTTTTDLSERMNNLSLIHMSDTPDSFVGNALKSIRVRAAEDGVEFIDSPETAILAALAGGNLPIKWNNMKQKIAASSADISANSITENAFTLGLGGTAGRKFILPDIVDADTVPLPANSVREGRLTIISQQGSGSREVELTAGCKFTSGGTTTTTNPTIPAGQAWILLPALYANGDKNWSIVGSFSANQSGGDLVGGQVRVGHRNITADAFIVTNGSVNQEKTANCRLVAPVSGSIRAITLPELVPFAHTEPLTSTQARQGKTITVWSASTSSTNLNLASGQKWLINNVESDGVRLLPSGVMETYFGIIQSGIGKWVLMHRTKADGSPVEFEGLDTRVSALEAGGGGPGGADVGPLIIRLDDHQDRIETLEANHGGVDLNPILDRLDSLEELDLAPLTGRVTDVETFANGVADKVDALENKPHPSFFDLTNTPSAGTPGKMLAFNLAGDSLVAVDGVDSFRNLKDTPSSFTGQARKAVTVKADESGLEFASLPNLAPLQGEVNDLYNDMIAVNNSQSVQDRRLTALEAASGGSGSDTFLGLSDTPTAYTAKKILTVNAAGTGVEMSQATTDDLGGALLLAEGVTTGDVLLHQNCLGSPCVMSGEDVITATDIVNSSVILYSAWQNSNSVRLPKIAPYDASPLPLGHVRAGRITSIYNRTTNNKVIRVTVDPTSTGVILKDRVYNDIPNVDLTANRVLKLMPAINAGVPVWIVIENYTCA